MHWAQVQETQGSLHYVVLRWSFSSKDLSFHEKEVGVMDIKSLSHSERSYAGRGVLLRFGVKRADSSSANLFPHL